MGNITCHNSARSVSTVFSDDIFFIFRDLNIEMDEEFKVRISAVNQKINTYQYLEVVAYHVMPTLLVEVLFIEARFVVFVFGERNIKI